MAQLHWGDVANFGITVSLVFNEFFLILSFLGLLAARSCALFEPLTTGTLEGAHFREPRSDLTG